MSGASKNENRNNGSTATGSKRERKSIKTASDHLAQTAIAATAGKDNWQTWAGRKHGTEDLEYLDIFRGMKRVFANRFLVKAPSKGTSCPICFCEPEAPSEWHVTWCGHAVCKDCLARYAASHVADPEQSGPLKCPICLKTLRERDAIAAMMAGDNQKELIQQWDTKTRDHLLRAIPSFQSCPNCDGGGGFVTAECLAPQHQERREEAIKILLRRNVWLLGILVSYSALVWMISRSKSPSAHLDLYCMVAPIYVFVKMGMTMHYWLASRAREALFRPISVGCPCCDNDFVLPAESAHFADDESSRWLKANTRPCPSCSVPIVKTEGCNHMRCSHCKADFCWACMRLQTTCRAYRCNNGARYGNASPFDGGEALRERRQALRSDGSILTYIDHIIGNRRCPDLTYGDTMLILACLLGRHLGLVLYLERKITYVLMNVILPTLYYVLQLAVPTAMLFSAARDAVARRDNARRDNGEVRVPRGVRGNGDFNVVEAWNQHQINEAIRRSIDDT
ncbi:unnamed protein product [Pseudo-nitzschia multistriata]|uniref:RING-type domain-containing protein n=1 Tax=Pseudo-nitzschia multistriata TaxID=183589 RepID=A0A448ZJT5_9STRA|nr:unnamed protein product [Pseudo-nitzschia multistriata]